MRTAINIGGIVGGAFGIAFGINAFLLPHHLISGGLSGVATLLHDAYGWPVSFLFFLLNVPLILWGLVRLGLAFSMYTILSVVSTTAWVAALPVLTPTFDLPVSAIFGGVCLGVGIGVSLRVGGSSGGFDVLGAILSSYFDWPFGQLLLVLNGVVLLLHGMLHDWNAALWSLIGMYTSVRIIESIHMKYTKVTVLIMSAHYEALREQLLPLRRGITLLHAEGGYSRTEGYTILTVTTRYELPHLKRIIRETDPRAFVNVLDTVDMIGAFRKLK